MVGGKGGVVRYGGGKRGLGEMVGRKGGGVRYVAGGGG